MKIDRNNYEAYFIDYLEGNLDENLINDFIEFIRQNPDLKEELELAGSVSLSPEELEFGKKANLYRKIYDNEKEFNRAAIAQTEGDLKEDEKPAFEDYLLRHPEKQKEVALFSKTKLHPDESVQFSKKNKLYRRSSRQRILLWTSRIAAVMVLAFSVYLFLNNSAENISEKQLVIAEQETDRQEELSSENARENVSEKPLVSENEKQIAGSHAEQKKTEEAAINPEEKVVSNREKNRMAKNTTDKTVPEQTITARIPVEAPARINRLSAKVKAQAPAILPVSVGNYRIQSPVAENREEERLIGDIVREKAGLDNISLDKITRTGLKLISSFSKDNLTYETNANGKITELNFDSRLLAFSIPTNSDE